MWVRRPPLVLVAALAFTMVVVAACGGSNDGPGATPEASAQASATASGSSTTAAPATASATPTAPAVALPAAPGIKVPAGFKAQTYATGLAHPTAMAFGPDGRLYVTE